VPEGGHLCGGEGRSPSCISGEFIFTDNDWVWGRLFALFELPGEDSSDSVVLTSGCAYSRPAIGTAGFTGLRTPASGRALGNPSAPSLGGTTVALGRQGQQHQLLRWPQALTPLLLHRLLPTSSGKAGTGPLSSTRAPHNSRIGHERCWTWSGSPRAPLPSVPATPRCLPSPRPCHLPSSHHAPTSSKPFVHPMPCFRQTWSGVSPPAGSTSAGCAGMLVLGKIRLFPSLRSPCSYQQAAPGLPRARCRGRARLQPGQTGA